uniref:Putative ovule protein n=1 Tax=Solanum chacoense TaxID=4108 RepID=A0A0V0GRT6_SOLCH
MTLNNVCNTKMVRNKNKIFVTKGYLAESFSNSIFLFVLTCLSKTICDMNTWGMSITKPCKETDQLRSFV